MKVRLCVLAVITAVTVILGFSAVALAAKPSKKTLLLVVEGGGRRDETGEALRAVLAKRYAMVTAADERLQTALANEHKGASLSAALSTPKHDAFLERLRTLARGQGIDAVIAIEMPSPSRKAMRYARMVVIGTRGAASPNGADVALSYSPNASVDVACLSTAVEEPLASLDDAVEPPTAEPQSKAEPQPSADSWAGFAEVSSAEVPRDSARSAPKAVSPRGDDPTRAILVAHPHFDVGTRNFEYVDAISPGLASYDLGGAPRIGIGAEAYPLAALGDGPSSGIGIAGDCTTAFGLQSAGSDGRSVDTRWNSYDIALKYRLPVAERSAVYGKLGYGGMDFDLSADPIATPANHLPSASYRFVRTGVDGRVGFGKLAAMAGLDYLFVQSAGLSDTRFPRASVGGIEARLGVGYVILSHFELRTGLVYQRFFYDLKPEKGDALVAGGALDQFARWESSLAFAY